MISLKSLANTFHRLDSGHAPTAVYQKWFSHWDDNICWWCGGTVSQTWEHLFRHCSSWRDHQRKLSKAAIMATCWRAGGCRPVQIPALLSNEEWDQALMDFLVATEVRKCPPKWSSGMEWAQRLGIRIGIGGNRVIPFALSFFSSFFSVILLCFICQHGRRVAGEEIHHVGGSPGGGRDIRVLSSTN